MHVKIDIDIFVKTLRTFLQRGVSVLIAFLPKIVLTTS